MSKLVHFEITGKNAANLAQFYANALGFSVSESPFMPDYHLLAAKNGDAGGAVMDQSHQQQAAILWFETDDLDATLASIARSGGRAVGDRSEIPGEGAVCYAADPEGNIFGLKRPE